MSHKWESGIVVIIKSIATEIRVRREGLVLKGREEKNYVRSKKLREDIILPNEKKTAQNFLRAKAKREAQ